MSAIQAKLDERGVIYNQMKDLKDRAKKEDRSLTTDETLQWDKAFADYKSIGEEITAIEKQYEISQEMDKLEYEQKSVFDKSTPTQRADEVDIRTEYKKAVTNWMFNPKQVTKRELSILEDRAKYVTALQKEQRGTATQVTTDAGLGGYIVPEEWQPELTKALIDYSGMLEACRVISTNTGRQMHWPKIPFAGGGSAAVQKGHRIAEDTPDTVADINYTEMLLDAYVYSSYEIRWSWEEMQDAMFDAVGQTLEIGGQRLGMIINEELTTADGSAKPQGIVPASALGKTAASNAAITGDELVDLKYSIKRPYRRSPKCGFMFNDNLEGAIVKLSYGVSDTSVWVPSFREGSPDKILGHPYWINDDMADIATVAKTVLFGDFNKYIIRKAGYPELARSDERDMANRRSVFYVFARYDGDLSDANAVNHLIQAV